MSKLPKGYKLTPTAAVETEAYTLRLKFKEEGWAEITVNRTLGLIAITSDWLSGAYHWLSIGDRSLEEFFAQAGGDSLCNKLFPKDFDVVDEKAAEEILREAIKDAVETCELSETDAEEHLDYIQEYVDEWCRTYCIPNELSKNNIDKYVKLEYPPHGMTTQCRVMRDFVLPALQKAVLARFLGSQK